MTAKEILEVLEETCGGPMDREDFLRRVGDALASGEKLEYRFQGHLGFGGKLWIPAGHVPVREPYVTCYQEDQTAGRKMLIDMANAELSRLWVNGGLYPK